MKQMKSNLVTSVISLAFQRCFSVYSN